MKEEIRPAPVWEVEHRVLTLEGEPVLEYSLRLPRLPGARGLSRRINWYYAALARQWRLRWQREVYWQACLDLARRRQEGRPFTPWRGRLDGEVKLWEGDTLSISLTGEESRGSRKPCRVKWGDTWQVKEGAPCPPARFFPGKGNWKKTLLSRLTEAGRAMAKSGEHFFDSDWEDRLGRWLSRAEVWLTPEGMEWALPPCAISPAAEGVPLFSLPREGPPEGAESRKSRKKSPAKKFFKKSKISS